MHGEAVGFGVTPGVALAYVVVAGGLYAAGKSAVSEAAAPMAVPAE
jgi:AGZA family xanthine/uracil permease-like MFS transporter